MIVEVDLLIDSLLNLSLLFGITVTILDETLSLYLLIMDLGVQSLDVRLQFPLIGEDLLLLPLGLIVLLLYALQLHLHLLLDVLVLLHTLLQLSLLLHQYLILLVVLLLTYLNLTTYINTLYILYLIQYECSLILHTRYHRRQHVPLLRQLILR